MIPITPEQNVYLTQMYLNPRHPASFQSPAEVYHAVKNEGRYQLTHEQIRRWIQNQEGYSKNKKVNRQFQRNRVVVGGIDDQWDADLGSFYGISAENDGVKYFLAVIDIFSRYAWVRPLHDKTAKSIAAAFQDILNEGRKPDRLRTDAATDFTSITFQTLCTQNKVRHFTTHGEKQANYVERFIQTLKTRIYKYMNEGNVTRYIDVLQDFVHSYNNSYHSGIQMEPAYVNSTNENKLWWQMYLPDEFFSNTPPPKRPKVTYRFNVDDTVRITYTPSGFNRKYDQKWSSEIFKVAERFHRYHIPIYKVKDLNEEILKGTFYQSELQHVDYLPEATFKIEKILKYKGRGRKKKALVKWLDWPSRFNQWIDASAVIDL